MNTMHTTNTGANRAAKSRVALCALFAITLGLMASGCASRKTSSSAQARPTLQTYRDGYERTFPASMNYDGLKIYIGNIQNQTNRTVVFYDITNGMREKTLLPGMGTTLSNAFGPKKIGWHVNGNREFREAELISMVVSNRRPTFAEYGGSPKSVFRIARNGDLVLLPPQQ
jgi:hypothetical protein